MADFSYLSDTDDSAVEDLISQAQDLCVLEQVSAINCSGFTDSELPSDLESRFRKLKSFPAATKRTSIPSTGSTRRCPIEDEDAAIFSPSKENPDEKMGSDPKSTSGSVSSPLEFSVKRRSRGSKAKPNNFSASSPSNSSNSSPESAIFSPSKQNPEKKRRSKLKSISRSLSSPFGSCNSLTASPSPPRKPGCFWCSPKTKRSSDSDHIKSKSIGGLKMNFGNDDELLSDLKSFSKKEQTRKLKKALKEEEKICREADKIVKWAKQASARMTVTGIDDELSDDQNLHSPR